jgi:hemoglobin-like flavoprotein
MTPRQVDQVQASFAKVAPIADRAAALFYDRLFETAPEVKALFSGNMHIQGRQLMAALRMVVNSLGQIEEIAPMVCNLAKRHLAYGVRQDHYAVVGVARLWTLEQGLGDEFTPAIRTAWAAAYSTSSETMIACAYPSRFDLRAASGAT